MKYRFFTNGIHLYVFDTELEYYRALVRIQDGWSQSVDWYRSSAEELKRWEKEGMIRWLT